MEEDKGYVDLTWSDDDMDILQQMLHEDERESQNKSADSIGSKSKRGRKRIPEQWSRVINIYRDDLSRLKAYELAPDLLLASAVRSTPTTSKKKENWRPIFWPKDYEKTKASLKLKDNYLTEAQL